MSKASTPSTKLTLNTENQVNSIFRNDEEMKQMSIAAIGNQILEAAIEQRRLTSKHELQRLTDIKNQIKSELYRLHNESLSEEKENIRLVSEDEANDVMEVENQENNRTFNPLDGIWVEGMTGHYTKRIFRLRPTTRIPCYVGRATSKRYKSNGMCLQSDDEISSEHGKFELVNKESIFYTDTGSTNGSSYVKVGMENSKENCVCLDPHEPLQLQDGIILYFGETSSFKIHFSKEW